MARGINKVILVGNLGRDPEIRHNSGTAFASVSLATSESWTDKSTGEAREETEWHRLSFAGRLAEIAGEYLRKGSLVYVEGRLQTRKWQGNDGQDRYTTEIKCLSMQMLGGSKRQGEHQAEERAGTPSAPRTQGAGAEDYAGASGGSIAARRQTPQQPAAAGVVDDDIPF